MSAEPIEGTHGKVYVKGPGTVDGTPCVLLSVEGAEAVVIDAEDFANMVIYTGLSIAGRIRESQNKPRRG